MPRSLVAVAILSVAFHALFYPSPSVAGPFSSCASLLTRITTVLKGSAVSRPPAEPAHSPILDLLSSKPLTDPEVLRLFTRSPLRNIVHLNYLENMPDSLREAFVPWLEGQSKLSYREMLRKQHRILTRGLNGSNPYLSTDLNQPLQKRNIGRFRYETWLPALHPELRFSMSAFYDSPEDYPDYFLEFAKKRDGSTRYLTAIEGIPHARRPDCRLTISKTQSTAVTDLRLYMTYPSASHSETYVDAIEVLMVKLKNTPVGAPREEWVPLLADFIQLFSAGLPFERVNFSIAMSQVNTILMKQGLRGVENGELDLASVMMPTAEFREVFIKHVEKAQQP